MKEIKLNLGCGEDIREGWINMDVNPKDDSVIQIDFEMEGLKFTSDKEADYVLCSHLLEHIHDLVAFRKELARVMKPGATLEIVVPYYLSPDAWGDPEHCRAFSLQSFMPCFWPEFENGRVTRRSVRKEATREDCVWLHVIMTRKEE